MLERVIENWLTNCNERAFETPFAQLLSAEGFRVLHGPVHHPFEHGKDIVAVGASGELHAFQLKADDIDLGKLESLQGQLFALAVTAIDYPGVEPPRRPDRVSLVTNGRLTPPARDRLEAMNAGNRAQALPIIECVEIENLVGRFRDAHGAYLPISVPQFEKLLRFVLSDGEDFFPVMEFSAFLKELLAVEVSGKSALDHSRSLASATLLTAYCVGPWVRSENRLSVALGWLCMATTTLWCAEEWGLDEAAWLDTYDLAFVGVRTEMNELLTEALSEEDLVVPDLVDGIFYSTRALLVCGSVSAFYLSERFLGDTRELGDRAATLLKREARSIKVIGESGTPLVIAMGTALERLGDKTEASSLVVAWLRGLTAANGQDSANALPDPYHRLEEVIDWRVGLAKPDSSERWDGIAYTLVSVVDWLARRAIRGPLEELWSAISKLSLCEHVCSTPSKILAAWHESGRLRMSTPPATESWEKLRGTASRMDEEEIPTQLWRHPELLPYLGIVYPHRFTVAVSKALDFWCSNLGSVKLSETPTGSRPGGGVEDPAAS